MEQGYEKKVQITVVVVQKRHHTRFFPGNTSVGRDDRKNNNVPAGTIVDQRIVRPTENQFYLVSHQSIQGVAKPTKYCILLDDGNHSIDDLQALTYNVRIFIQNEDEKTQIHMILFCLLSYATCLHDATGRYLIQHPHIMLIWLPHVERFTLSK